MKRKKDRIVCLLIFSLILVLSSACMQEKSTLSEAISTPDPKKELSITMLDVGQGLSLLLESDGEYMLYDGGGREHSSTVVTYLKNMQIDSLTYLVASHYDEDHIAGLIGAMNTVDVSLALTPDYETDTEIYQSFCRMVEGKHIKEEHPYPGQTYPLGYADIQVMSPDAYDWENDNNNSIVMKVTMGEFSCLLCGDAEQEAEENMVAEMSSEEELKSNLLVVAHHGSSSSTSQIFLDAVSPQYAWISVGEGNDYGHPTKTVLNRLKKAGVELYRTDMQGDITLTTDGKNISLNKDSCDSWASVTKVLPSDNKEEIVTEGSENRMQDSTYILNTKSHKFHKSSCSSISKMSARNKKEVSADREDLIAQGYEPCGNCKP